MQKLCAFDSSKCDDMAFWLILPHLFFSYRLEPAKSTHKGETGLSHIVKLKPLREASRNLFGRPTVTFTSLHYPKTFTISIPFYPGSYWSICLNSKLMSNTKWLALCISPMLCFIGDCHNELFYCLHTHKIITEPSLVKLAWVISTGPLWLPSRSVFFNSYFFQGWFHYCTHPINDDISISSVKLFRGQRGWLVSGSRNLLRLSSPLTRGCFQTHVHLLTANALGVDNAFPHSRMGQKSNLGKNSF